TRYLHVSDPNDGHSGRARFMVILHGRHRAGCDFPLRAVAGRAARGQSFRMESMRSGQMQDVYPVCWLCLFREGETREISTGNPAGSFEPADCAPVRRFLREPDFLKLSEAKITTAELVPAGGFAHPTAGQRGNAYRDVPESQSSTP